MERRKVLIATKTYPSISTKYKETVCTAGILLDDAERPTQWIRIYPVRFRSLEIDKRYKRWNIISAKIERNKKDFREESYRIEDTSIKSVRQIGTDNFWEERKSFVFPLQFDSISQIRSEGKSLGIIKPKSIEKYFCRTTEREWSPKQQAVQDQGDLFEPSVELDKIPYQFGYKFTTRDGSSHSYTISDWEISQLYRNCIKRSKASQRGEKEQEGLNGVRKKLENDFLKTKDLYFIVGNLKNHPQNFMIIGLFYPQKSRNIGTQQTLNLFES